MEIVLEELAECLFGAFVLLQIVVAPDIDEVVDGQEHVLQHGMIRLSRQLFVESAHLLVHFVDVVSYFEDCAGHLVNLVFQLFA